MSAADAVAEEFAKPPPGDPVKGIFQRMDGAYARVLVGEGVNAQAIPVAIIGAYQPITGQGVWLARLGSRTYLLGPAENGPAIGEVVDVSEAPIIYVEVPPGSGADAQSFGAPTGMSLAPGDFVVIDRNVPIIVGGPYSLAALPENAAPDDPDGGGGGPQSRTFQAIDSGSWNGGSWWTNDVWDSVSNDGAAFYGTQITDTLPDAATISAVAVFLSLSSSFGDPPILRLVSGASKGGDPSFTGPSFALPFLSGWVSIPTTFIDPMRTGNYGLGFEASTGGYNVFNGTQADAQAFTLLINYTS